MGGVVVVYLSIVGADARSGHWGFVDHSHGFKLDAAAELGTVCIRLDAVFVV